MPLTKHTSHDFCDGQFCFEFQINAMRCYANTILSTAHAKIANTLGSISVSYRFRYILASRAEQFTLQCYPAFGQRCHHLYSPVVKFPLTNIAHRFVTYHWFWRDLYRGTWIITYLDNASIIVTTSLFFLSQIQYFTCYAINKKESVISKICRNLTLMFLRVVLCTVILHDCNAIMESSKKD